jgi:hypothetical protein
VFSIKILLPLFSWTSLLLKKYSTLWWSPIQNSLIILPRNFLPWTSIQIVHQPILIIQFYATTMSYNDFAFYPFTTPLSTLPNGDSTILHLIIYFNIMKFQKSPCENHKTICMCRINGFQRVKMSPKIYILL